nr:molybdenum cofactor guanylyltransferase [uncultured Pedobacter sp.]
MKLTGLILSGGESKRAGTDKGLKTSDGKTWVELMRQKLLDLNLEVKVSINSSQLSNYQNVITKENLIVDDATIPGPLRGILTAHAHFPANNWLVLACDQIDMEKAVIEKLICCLEENPGFDFYAYKSEKRYQPFCGIYTAQGLQKLLKTYRSQHEENYSMQHVFDSFNTFTIAIKDESLSFNNYNN